MIKSFSKEQYDLLIKEARKVRNYEAMDMEIVESLQYLAQVCFIDFDKPRINFCIVMWKDNRAIRCYVWEDEITILDNAIQKYSLDTPEDLIRVLDDMYHKYICTLEVVDLDNNNEEWKMKNTERQKTEEE